MFSILIVDDEPSVVDTIAHTLDWESLLIDDVYCAYSAKEALRIIKKNHVDIVMTDIRMPGMDGLELIEETRKKSKHTEFILLTGHDEFEYAQKGLKLRTADYLLKPVSDEDLEKSILNLTLKLQHKWNEISSHQTTLEVLRSNLPILRHDLLRNLLVSGIPSTELEEKLSVLELPFTIGDEFYPLIVRLEGTFSKFNPDDLYLIEYAILNIAEEIFSSSFHLWTCKDIHEYLVLVIKPHNDADMLEQDYEMISNLATRFQKNIATYLHGNISVVIGNQGQFPEDLTQQYQTLVQTMRRRIGKDSGLVINTNSKTKVQSVTSKEILHEPPSLIHLFEAGMWDDVNEKLTSFFNELELNGVETPDLLAEMYHMLSAACYRYAHLNETTLQDLLAGYGEELPKLERMMSINAIKEWAYGLCEYLNQDNQVSIKNEREVLIEQVKEYIHFHLEDDVSLQTLANHVNYHPVYLSKVFKLKTGLGLNDYLSQVRMDKAVHLLENTEAKIYEITAQIGYSNTAYFIRVFKKHFNLTPQEYREDYLNNKE